MSVKKLLTEQIESQFEALDELEYGSDIHKAAVEDLTKLLGKLNEMEKIELEQANATKAHEDDYMLKIKQMEIDNENKALQMKEERNDHWIKNGLTLLGLVVGTGVTIWGTKLSIKFEETGTITTFAGRAFFNKLFSKK